MVVLILDLWFKDLSLMRNYVGYSFAIEIVTTYERKFLLPTLKTLYQKHHGRSNASTIVQETMCNINVVFGVGSV